MRSLANLTKPCNRMCVVCRKMKDKSELIRFVVSGDDVIADKSFKSQCRGAYVCRDRQCLSKVIKTKALSRALGHNVSEDVIKSISKSL